MSGQTILVANGVNLDLLGSREKDQYGSFSLSELESYICSFVDTFSKAYAIDKPQIEFFQSNDEAKYLEKVSQSFDALVLNPGAWTHTSIALADRLRTQICPIYEVHISNVHARESFRKISYISELCRGVVSGLGKDSYTAAITAHLLSN